MQSEPFPGDLDPRPAAEPWLRFGPLQRRLFLIALVALLPVATLALATLVWNATEQRDNVIEATENTAGAVLGAIDTEIAVNWATLDALAASPRITMRDWPGVHGELVDALKRRAGIANLVLSTPEAQQIVNAAIPYGQPLPSRVDPANMQAVARSGRPGVGGIVPAPAIGGFAFGVSVPVFQDGRVAHVLTAAVRPEPVREMLERRLIPEGAVAVVLDARRNVVARSRGHDQYVARSPSKGLLTLLESDATSGRGISDTLEGVAVYTVYRRSPVTGWTVAIGLPKSAVDAPVIRAYATLGGGIVLSVALGLMAAFLAARTITRPMRELERAAAAVALGTTPPRVDTDIPEVAKAAHALAEAHAEREKLLASEREARFAAEEASRGKDQFLAMLGHELRNPLAAISAAAHILDQVDTGEAADEAKRILRRQATNLGRMTDDLLDAGRLMTGKVALRRVALDLSEAVARVVDTMRSTGRLANHEVDVDAVPAWVDADPTRIEQIVGNLVTNAIKFTPPGRAIHVAVQREGTFATLRVRDEGIGIDGELLSRVFDLFVQGPRTLERAEGGIGVGLALVRRLVALHGGTVSAHSEGSGKGSEFVVRLPLVDMPPRRVVEAQRLPGARRRIVLVEDNEDARHSVVRLLQLLGHDVREAADGKSGVEAIVAQRPDLALVDIGLPGYDGYAVARAVRERLGRSVTLVALSGYGRERDLQEARNAGFDEFIVKPLAPERLEALLSASNAREAAN